MWNRSYIHVGRIYLQGFNVLTIYRELYLFHNGRALSGNRLQQGGFFKARRDHYTGLDTLISEIAPIAWITGPP